MNKISRGLIKENSLKDHDAHDNDDDSDDYYTVILIMKVLAIIVMMMMVFLITLGAESKMKETKCSSKN